MQMEQNMLSWDTFLKPSLGKDTISRAHTGWRNGGSLERPKDKPPGEYNDFSGRPQGAPTADNPRYAFPELWLPPPPVKYLPGGPPPPSNDFLSCFGRPKTRRKLLRIPVFWTKIITFLNSQITIASDSVYFSKKYRILHVRQDGNRQISQKWCYPKAPRHKTFCILIEIRSFYEKCYWRQAK